MSEQKHTPGPWEIGEVRAKEQEVWIDTDASDPRLSYSRWSGLAVAYGCDEQPIQGAEVAMANARLIAAAPELLEALRAYVAQHTNLLRGFSTVPTLQGDAESAIYKATGELSTVEITYSGGELWRDPDTGRTTPKPRPIPAEDVRRQLLSPTSPPNGKTADGVGVPACGPLRELGSYLARVLDEDQWAHAEALLLKVAPAVNPSLGGEPIPSPSVGQREQERGGE